MSNKKLIPLVALLLLGAGALAASGAAQAPGAGVRVPPGEIVVSPNASLGVRNNAARPAISQAPGLPPATGTVAFSADFASADTSSFRSVNSAPLAVAGTWVARDGRLQQRGNAQGEVANDATIFAVRDVTLQDGVVEAQYLPTSGEPGGLVFRGSDAGYYRVTVFPEMQNDAAKITLEKVTSSGATQLAKAPVSTWSGARLSQWQMISVKAEGSAITVSVDGRAVISATDGGFPGGWAGVWSTADMGVQFDNVRVQRLEN